MNYQSKQEESYVNKIIPYTVAILITLPIIFLMLKIFIYQPYVNYINEENKQKISKTYTTNKTSEVSITDNKTIEDDEFTFLDTIYLIGFFIIFGLIGSLFDKGGNREDIDEWERNYLRNKEEIQRNINNRLRTLENDREEMNVESNNNIETNNDNNIHEINRIDKEIETLQKLKEKSINKMNDNNNKEMKKDLNFNNFNRKILLD